VVDGDQILAVLALAMHDRGSLAGDTVVRDRDVQPWLPDRDEA